MDGNSPGVASSALTQFLESSQTSVHLEDSSKLHQYNLALQVLHNLQHQHRWTGLNTHGQISGNSSTLPRHLISGVPPTRLYIHPEEQIEIINAERERARKNGTSTENGEVRSSTDETEVKPEPEWVLPTHIREEWSLEKFSQIFDAIEAVPPGHDTIPVNSKWRTTKRLLLAIMQDDSTVVYYIIHDGIVKPRQN